MINIEELDYKRMKGEAYSTEIHSDRYLSIEPQEDGFLVEWKTSDQEIIMPFRDIITTVYAR